MKILLTSTLYPTPHAPKIVGGAEIFARRFAEGLAQRGDEVEVIRAASAPEQARELCNGINVYSAPVRNVYLPFTEQKNVMTRSIWHAIDDWQIHAPAIAERIQAFKPDVLHTNNLSGLTTAIWRVAARLGVPVLHTLHDYYLTCPRCSRFNNGRSCERTCTSCGILTYHRKRATHWLSAVVGVSERVLSIHTDMGMFAETPIRTVIRNASTEPPRSPYPRPVCTTEVTFGFIGRLTEEKGIDNLMRTLAMLPPDRIRMMIAGRVSDEEQQRLRKLAPDARIEFMWICVTRRILQASRRGGRPLHLARSRPTRRRRCQGSRQAAARNALWWHAGGHQARRNGLVDRSRSTVVSREHARDRCESTQDR
ncbi:glycosyltransferase involved in cell wall biosynthesis [Bradyrhizobium sp. LM2.9]